jgi:hypothetical protein
MEQLSQMEMSMEYEGGRGGDKDKEEKEEDDDDKDVDNGGGGGDLFISFTFHRFKLGYSNCCDIEIVIFVDISSTKQLIIIH